MDNINIGPSDRRRHILLVRTLHTVLAEPSKHHKLGEKKHSGGAGSRQSSFFDKIQRPASSTHKIKKIKTRTTQIKHTILMTTTTQATTKYVYRVCCRKSSSEFTNQSLLIFALHATTPVVVRPCF
jgi:hypothetical protein